jgi:Domain of unknown function (DUF1844).
MAEEQGFVIRDRRAGGGTEPPPVAASTAHSSTSGETSQPESSQSVPLPPVTFSSFVISLGSSSLMLMGEAAGPSTALHAYELAASEGNHRSLVRLGRKDKRTI